MSKPIRRVDLVSRDECLDGGWFVWRCEVEYEDGSTALGYVQADYSGEGEPYLPSLELDE